MGAELDPFNLGRMVAGAGENLGDLLAEVAAMARRLAIGPLFLVHPDDVDRVLAKLRELEAELASDPLADVRACPFVEAGTLLVITAEARAAAHDAGLTDDLLANPQGDTAT